MYSGHGWGGRIWALQLSMYTKLTVSYKIMMLFGPSCWSSKLRQALPLHDKITLFG